MANHCGPPAAICHGSSSGQQRRGLIQVSVARARPAGLGGLGRARGFDPPDRLAANALAAAVGGHGWDIPVGIRR